MQNLVDEASAATPNGASKAVDPDSFLTLHYRVALGNDTDIVTTFSDKPATLLLDQGQMAPTLGQALLDMRGGKRTTSHLAPEHAFGLRNPKLLQRVSLATLHESSSFEEDYQSGDLIEFNASSGDRCAGVLKEVDETSTLLDFNHPLADQAIVSEVQLIGIL